MSFVRFKIIFLNKTKIFFLESKKKYKKIDYAKDLEKVLKEAVNFNGTVLVEVNVASVGEMPRYFAPPPHALKK